jgi:putative nucleotidyltransferase with HDIG domain
MRNELIVQVEEYVKSSFSEAGPDNDLLIAHDYQHVNRVHRWAMCIAQGEGYTDILSVELAALLHDIGLPGSKKKEKRNKHGESGAAIATKYLMEKSNLPEKQINNIATAIKYHGASPSTIKAVIENNDGSGMLLKIIRDADMIDAIGATGLMRAFTSKASLPEYDPLNVKGETWGFSSKQFDERFANKLGIGNYLLDQINFQISYYDNLHTITARNLATPLVDYMRFFILQLEHEIVFQDTNR